MASIFLVEDEDNIRELVYYALKSEGYKVTAFDSSINFWKHIAIDTPSLILLDIMLPGESGLDILRIIKKNKSTTHIPVIMLTAVKSEKDRIDGLDAGADDYITKPFSVDELLARVRAVLRRATTPNYADISSGGFNVNDLHLDLKKRLVTVEGIEVKLTFLEFELLLCLLNNKDIVMSREQLLNLVWKIDEHGGPADRNVDMQIKSLRKKLGNCGDLIKTVRNVGYKIKG